MDPKAMQLDGRMDISKTAYRFKVQTNLSAPIKRIRVDEIRHGEDDEPRKNKPDGHGTPNV